MADLDTLRKTKLTKVQRIMLGNLLLYERDGVAMAAPDKGTAGDRLITAGYARWITNSYGYPRLCITTSGRAALSEV